ncbi:hypothetical protein AGMMS49957_14010 [Synergistales bacterium]|nr:hypothetical protein AGMMS49957_14010 [Synergistales bacterium]
MASRTELYAFYTHLLGLFQSRAGLEVVTAEKYHVRGRVSKFREIRFEVLFTPGIGLVQDEVAFAAHLFEILVEALAQRLTEVVVARDERYALLVEYRRDRAGGHTVRTGHKRHDLILPY